MKLGLKPHFRDPRDLRLADYGLFAEPPSNFGHGDLVQESEWGMLGNDRYGDCVWAGAAHETLVLGREGGHKPQFDSEVVLSDYSRFTGFNPALPYTDQGTDVRSAARARKSTGILSVDGKRHHIGAYLWLTPGDVSQLFSAAYIFGVVGCAYAFPNSAMTQFDHGQPWDYNPREPNPNEGHYVPTIGRCPTGNIDAVSWGRRIEITPAFYEHYNDSALVYVSAAAIGPDGVTPEGFDKERLLADLNALKEES